MHFAGKIEPLITVEFGSYDVCSQFLAQTVDIVRLLCRSKLPLLEMRKVERLDWWP